MPVATVLATATVCLANALGAVTLDVDDGFVLAWTHSIEKIRWEEYWQVQPSSGTLLLHTVRVRGFGAGMEPAAQAVLVDGAWQWHPRTRHESLRLTRSPFTDDYEWCSPASPATSPGALDPVRLRCQPLGAVLPSDGDITSVRPCARL